MFNVWVVLLLFHLYTTFNLPFHVNLSLIYVVKGLMLFIKGGYTNNLGTMQVVNKLITPWQKHEQYTKCSRRMRKSCSTVGIIVRVLKIRVFPMRFYMHCFGPAFKSKHFSSHSSTTLTIRNNVNCYK